MNAPGGTLVRLRGEIASQELEIPGGNPAVHTARLHVDDASRASTLLVRFPAGWERPSAGSYSSAEEFVLLDGTIEMNDITYRAGDWVYVPAGAERRNTVAPGGALALARFAGPARWRPGEGHDTAPLTTSLAASPPGTGASPLGPGTARLLHVGEDLVSSWLLDGLPPGESPAPVEAELLTLEKRVWAWAPAGSPLPRLEGRCFCRTFSAERGTGGSR